MLPYLILLSFGLVISVIAIIFGIMFSRYFEITDHPGEHKQHQVSTPFIGGLGIIAASLVVLKLAYNYQLISSDKALVIATGASVIFMTGFIDDVWRLGYKIRFLIQGLAACLMFYGGEIVLSDLGQIMPGGTLELGLLALPFTLFATIGVINAVNMIDGIDGLSGSVSLVSLLLLMIVTLLAGQHQHLVLIIALTSGVVGFLSFNLRCFGRRRALVFLGDNGSMLLGFLLAWLFIGLSQGQTPAMTPVTALWLFSIPLIDTVAVMIRRVWLGKSPFHPDRFHLHHLLLRAGFLTSDAVFLIALLHSLFGMIGLAGLYLEVWQPLMLVGFLGVFFGYLYVAFHPWRFILALRRLHTRLGLMKVGCQGVFIGHFGLEAANHVLRILQDEMTTEYEYNLQVYQMDSESAHPCLYTVLMTELTEEHGSEWRIRQLISRLKKYFSEDRNIEVRQYLCRDPMNDRRSNYKNTDQDLRRIERRGVRERIVVEAGYFLNPSFLFDVRFISGTGKVSPKQFIHETK